MATQQDDDIWQDVLSRFPLSHPRVAGMGGGTAAPKVIVEAEGRRFLLRRRRPRWSEPQVVSNDHGVIAAVVGAGLPAVLPERTRDGQTWAHVGDAAYELFPFVAGLSPFRQGDGAQIASAGESLARFHRATCAAQPPGAKAWPREHEMSALAPVLAEAIAASSATPIVAAAAREMLASARRLVHLLGADLVHSLPQAIIHGDYTPANVLFRGDAVGGIFDFDWVSRQARLIDVGEALQFFAFRRREGIDPNDIWSLVQTWEPDSDGADAFLDAYGSVWPLTPAEERALPLFMRETWLGIRIRAMRKVPAEQRLRILTDGAQPPLRWLEELGSLG